MSCCNNFGQTAKGCPIISVPYRLLSHIASIHGKVKAQKGDGFDLLLTSFSLAFIVEFEIIHSNTTSNDLP